MKYAGYVLAGLLLLGITGACVLYRGIHLEFLNPAIEKRLSAALDREVRLQKPLYLRVGREIELRTGGLSVANAPWSGEGPLLQLERGEIVLDTRSLFSGTIVVSRLHLASLDLLVDHDEDGDTNLPFLGGDSGDDDGKPGPRVLIVHTEVSELHLQSLHRGNGADLDFRVSHLVQKARTTGLTLEARGTLQDRAWTLSGDGSDLDSLLEGRNLAGTLKATLDDLTLDANYAVPDLHQLRDMTLKARLTGPLPPRIAALSPIFEADEAMSIDLDISDVDPGVALNADIRLQQLELVLRGTVDEPGSGDGIDLSLDLNAASLPRLARALNLGSTDEVPLRIDASLTRSGREFHLSDMVAVAGEHRITGDARIPAFPTADDARISLRVAGDDFRFVQKLLQRPATIPAAYVASIEVTGTSDNREQIAGSIHIGKIVAELSGLVGDHPGYAQSDLRLQLSGPDAESVGELLALPLPKAPFEGEGHVSIDREGKVRIEALELALAAVTLQAEGSLRGPPHYDELDLDIRAHSDSLARSSTLFGLKPLGDVPGSLKATVGGSLEAVRISGINADAGDLQLRQRAGTLSYGDGELRSDLGFAVRIAELSRVLGSYADPRLTMDSLSFELAALADADRISLQLTELQGPGIRGAAALTLPPDFSLGPETHLEADVRIDRPAQFIPSSAYYSPPQQALALRAKTRGDGERRIDLTLASDDTPLLQGTLQFPKGDSTMLFSVRGSGTDLRNLGDIARLPPGDLPYELDLHGRATGSALSLDIASLAVADTRVEGTVELDPDAHRVHARLNIPRAEIERWRSAWKPPETTAGAKKPREEARYLIPATELPLDLFGDWHTDVELSTGDLGIPDPHFPGESLIHATRLSVQGSDRIQRLTLHRLAGSRGEASLDSTLEVQDSRARLEVTVNVEELAIGIVTRGTNLATLPRHRIEAQLAMEGATYRDLAASLNADLLLTGGPGTVSNTGYSFATESFSAQFLSTLLPGLETVKADMEVSCTVLALRARDGVVKLDPGFVFRTGRVDMSARGVIDLRDESLAVRFDNQARKGLGISAASLVNPYVQISGTLAKPALGLDLKSSALAGGAAVATGGLTVIARPLFGRFLKRGDPCEEAVERWTQATAQPISATAIAPRINGPTMRPLRTP